ncbi:hypothetical protein, partial [Bacillus mobilis]|uniref:hypothetical protein n=1 Tax=Bacillus mobilis TaxID=2026190 RepID=UPI0036712017
LLASKKATWGCRKGLHDIFKAYLINSEFKKFNFIVYVILMQHFLEQFVYPKITSERLGHKSVFITLRMIYLGCKKYAVKTFSEQIFG